MEATSGISHLLTPIAWDITAFLKALRDPTGGEIVFSWCDKTDLWSCEFFPINLHTHHQQTSAVLFPYAPKNKFKWEREWTRHITGIYRGPCYLQKRDQETVNACEPGTIHSYFQLQRPWPTMEAPGLSQPGVQTPQICRKVWELRPVWLLPVSFQTGNEHSCMIMHKWSCININDHKCTMVPGLMQWAWVWKKQLLHSTCFDHIRYGHHMTPYFLLYIHILQSKLHERKQPAMLPTNHYVHPWRGHMSGLVWQLDVTSTLSVHSLFFLVSTVSHANRWSFHLIVFCLGLKRQTQLKGH